jgi:hypothetical protein
MMIYLLQLSLHYYCGQLHYVLVHSLDCHNKYVVSLLLYTVRKGEPGNKIDASV